MRKKQLPVIGWREWVGLPDLGILMIKAKVDTGARSSSLHSFKLETFERNGVEWVRFRVHPVQKKSAPTVVTEAEVLDHRLVRSSNGKTSLRPVIATRIRLLDQVWPIEVTLASRAEMGFRMLLGREAVRNRHLVDPGRSFYCGRPGRPKARRKKSAR